MSGTRTGQTGQIKRTHSNDAFPPPLLWDPLSHKLLGGSPYHAWKDTDEEHKFTFFQPSPLPCMQPKKQKAQKKATVNNDARPEVLSISSLEEANAWMKDLRNALENRLKDSKAGRQKRLESLWRSAAALQAFFCGREVACGAERYQIDIEGCLINFRLAVTARSPEIVDEIWRASENVLIKKISGLSDQEQIALLEKVLMNSLDLIYPYVERVTDIAVLEDARDNLSGNSKATNTKRRILQGRIDVLRQMELQAIANTQPIFYPPPQTATGLARFGLLPSPVPDPLVELPNNDVMEALMMLGCYPTR